MGRNFKSVPASRGFQFRPQVESPCPVLGSNSDLTDMFLHVFFARFAFNDGTVQENDTTFDQHTNTVELDIPEEYLQLIEGVTLGPNAVRYIQWLIKASQLWKIENSQLIPVDNDNTVSMNNLEVDKAAFFDEVISTTANIDWSTGIKQSITLTADTVLTFSPPPNPTSMQLIVHQTAAFNLTWPSGIKYLSINNITNTKVAGQEDVVSILYDGDSYYVTVAKGFRTL